MADDIVTRLREPGFCGVAAQHDAADEIERLRAEVNSMASAQAGWGRVARLNDEIERLRAVQVVDPAAIPTEVLADIDSQLCDDCDPFTSERIVCRLWQHGWRITRG